MNMPLAATAAHIRQNCNFTHKFHDSVARCNSNCVVIVHARCFAERDVLALAAINPRACLTCDTHTTPLNSRNYSPVVFIRVCVHVQAPSRRPTATRTTRTMPSSTSKRITKFRLAAFPPPAQRQRPQPAAVAPAAVAAAAVAAADAAPKRRRWPRPCRPVARRMRSVCRPILCR